MQLKLDGGLATSAWWKTKVEQTIDNWIAFDMCTTSEIHYTRKRINALASKLTSFLGEYLMKLVDIPTDLFTCCQNPSIISMDGIVLSVEQDRIRRANLSSPWLSEQTSRHRATTRVGRNIIRTTSKFDRDLLGAFATTGIDQDQLGRLGVSLEPAIFEMIQLVKKQNKERTGFVCNESFRSFFRSCSKQIFPAAHYLPYSVWIVAESVGINRSINVEQYDLAARNAPMFASHLNFIRNQQSETAVNTVLNQSL